MERFLLLVIGLASAFPVSAQQPPAITTQPVSETVLGGTDTQFVVSATGHKPLSYQWRFNENAIAGATNVTLTLKSVEASNAGDYSVVVSNSVGSVTSVTAVLIVVFPPSITQQPVSTTNVVGGAAKFSVAATGTPPLAYQWQMNGLPVAGANGPDFETNLCGSYSVVVTSLYGKAVSQEALLVWMYPPDLRQIDPCPSTAVFPQPIVAFTFIMGSPPLQLFARVNGVEGVAASWVAQTTNTPCLVSRVGLNAPVNLQPFCPGPGVYFVQLSLINPVGAATAPLFVIEYLADSPVSRSARAADASVTAAALPCFPSYILNRGLPGTLSLYGGSGGCVPQISTACGIVTNSSWYRFASTEAGTAVFSTEGSSDDTIMAVLQGSLLNCTNMTVVKCNDDTSLTNKQSRVELQVRATNTYYVIVGGLSSGGTNKLAYGYAPRISSLGFQPDRSFELYSEAAPPLSYQIQASTDLKPDSWATILSTNLLSTSIYFRDTNASKFTNRFYRIVPGP